MAATARRSRERRADDLLAQSGLDGREILDQ
jgi:hypothetical protein